MSWTKSLCVAIGIGGMLGQSTSAQTPELPDVSQTEVTVPTIGTILENVCHLSSSRFPWGGGFGSAVLFNERYLLTAGHNIYQDISRVRKVEVRCGVTKATTNIRCDRDPTCNEAVKGWQTMDAKRYDLFNFTNRHDYGVIRLNTPIVTSSPITLADEVPPKGTEVLLAGYPGGKSGFDAKTLATARAQLKENTGADKEVGRAEYNITTYTGNSGGPVWYKRPDESYALIAIHIQPSEGRLVNDEFKTEIRRIIRKLDERAARRGL